MSGQVRLVHRDWSIDLSWNYSVTKDQLEVQLPDGAGVVVIDAEMLYDYFTGIGEENVIETEEENDYSIAGSTGDVASSRHGYSRE